MQEKMLKQIKIYAIFVKNDNKQKQEKEKENKQ